MAYVHTEGELTFDDGEVAKEIEIQLLPDMPTDSRFQVLLTKATGATLNKRRAICEVRIRQLFQLPGPDWLHVCLRQPPSWPVIDNLSNSSSHACTASIHRRSLCST